MQEKETDVVVVGAGPVGENAAQYAAQGSGLDVVLVERERLGGECSYWACMPSKALLTPVETLDRMRGLDVWSGAVPGLDAGRLLARRDRVVSGPDHDDSSQVTWAEGAGLTVLRGSGRLVGERTVEVSAADGSLTRLVARHAVVLATGTRASVPPVPGLREALPWTSRDVTNLHEVPGRVVVVGGGVVACESATWLAALGSRVTMLVRGDALLERMEPFAGEAVAEALREKGVDVRLGVSTTSVRRDGARDTGEGHVHGGAVTVTLEDGADVVADEVLVAAGRTPSTDGLGLDTVGVSPGRGGYVEVDDTYAVTGAGGWLWAVGDVNGRALLTHMGKHQARLTGLRIAALATGGGTGSPWLTDLAGARAVPQVTFTSPPVASVGRTADEARAAGLDVRAVDVDLASLAGTYVQSDSYAGTARMVVDRATETVVGFTLVGHGTEELLHSATVAVVARVPLSTLWSVVPSYPTTSEVWLRLLEAWRAG